MVIEARARYYYNGKHPVVNTVDKEYSTGAKLTKAAMEIYEKTLDRMKGLEKWFVHISPQKAREALAFTEIFF
jgi:hypothetical protein